jgi:hypothetical protein
MHPDLADCRLLFAGVGGRGAGVWQAGAPNRSPRLPIPIWSQFIALEFKPRNNLIQPADQIAGYLIAVGLIE